jgi:penicillin-binding protein 1A
MDFVASAWVGFDDHEPIGPLETGGRAALPVWLEFMKAAHQGLPARDFETPPGVVQVKIDPASGLLAGRAVPGRTESFLSGTEPKDEALAPGTVDPNDFMMHDGRRGSP